MALNLEAVGKPIGPVSKNYTWKDVVLYALGVGSGSSELEYCYEKQLKVLPSFSIAAIFDFLAHIGATSNVNLAGILHGEQRLIFHHPIPTEGTLTTQGKITHYYDKGAKKAPLSLRKATHIIPMAKSSLPASSQYIRGWMAASAAKMRQKKMSCFRTGRRILSWMRTLPKTSPSFTAFPAISSTFT
ncbi:MAG: MaoC family dehydratase N-terminal domain-containing protein [Pseudomonadota bacterium]